MSDITIPTPAVITIQIDGTMPQVGCTTIGRILLRALSEAGITNVTIDNLDKDLVCDSQAEADKVIEAGVARLRERWTQIHIVDNVATKNKRLSKLMVTNLTKPNSQMVWVQPAVVSPETPLFNDGAESPPHRNDVLKECECRRRTTNPIVWFNNPEVNALLGCTGFYLGQLVIIGVHGTPDVSVFSFAPSMTRHMTIDMGSPIATNAYDLFTHFESQFRNWNANVITLDMRSCNTTSLGIDVLRRFYRRVRAYVVDHNALVIALHKEPSPYWGTTERLAMEADVCMHVAGDQKGTVWDISKYRMSPQPKLGKRVEVIKDSLPPEQPNIKFTQPALDKLTQRGLTLGSLVLFNITDPLNLADKWHWDVLGVTGVDQVNVANIHYRYRGIKSAITIVATMADCGAGCVVVRAKDGPATTEERRSLHAQLKDVAKRKNILIMLHEDNVNTFNTAPGESCDVIVDVAVYPGEWVCRCKQDGSLIPECVSIPVGA